MSADHAKRIRQQLLTAAENRAIDEMEVHVRPFVYLIVIALVLVGILIIPGVMQ